ncbi:MAG TPA: MlaD family protein [Acidimicrobiia bacterium]|nr:MlaD family protein [Acidimicrobiia bacterium]
MAFTAAMALIFSVLWVNMGGQLPFGITGGYRVTAALSDAQNLVYDSDVRIAGVRVGKVRGLRHDHGVIYAGMEIRGAAHPLHEGATVRLRPKTMIEETYLEVTDGTGPALPDRAALPASAEHKTVQLDDLLSGLDAPTRAALGKFATDLGAATAGHGGDLDATVAGLAALAREGHGPLDVLAAQTEDLKALVAETATLLGVLDQGQGQLARFVTSANRLSGASASRAQKIEETMRLLPAVLDAARAAGAPLRNLSGALTPLAGPLTAAGPDLAAAAAELGPAAAELRAVYPALGGVLDRAPATLSLTPGVATELSAIIPPARMGLADLNPMLAFLAPYGRDLTAFVANVGQVFSHADGAGHYVRTFVVLHDQSLKDAPVSTNMGPFNKSNAYPAPGASARPGPFAGSYSRVEEKPAAP